MNEIYKIRDDLKIKTQPFNFLIKLQFLLTSIVLYFFYLYFYLILFNLYFLSGNVSFLRYKRKRGTLGLAT